LACAELVRPRNPELADELEKRIIDPEKEKGLLDRLKKGHYHLWNMAEDQLGVTEVSIDSNTTGAIVDIKGEPTVDWDILKIIIETGGTLQHGSASTITYSTYGRDSTGLKTTQIIDSETVTGGWNNVGYGMAVRFSAGVYTANDEWELEVNGGRAENPVIGTIQLTRL
jgi:hypothetical protein